MSAAVRYACDRCEREDQVAANPAGITDLPAQWQRLGREDGTVQHLCAPCCDSLAFWMISTSEEGAPVPSHCPGCAGDHENYPIQWRAPCPDHCLPTDHPEVPIDG